jgi:mono/diheme cytochrome c family protein
VRDRFLKSSLRLAAVVALTAGVASSAFTQAPPAQGTDVYRDKITPLLGKYCFKCHGPQLKPKGELNMTKYGSEAAIRENRKVWKEVLNKIHTHEMPPPEETKEQPTAEERETITRWLEGVLNKVDPNAPKTAGRVTFRRLNRHEYQNTVRDLLAVDFNPVGDFPMDDVGYGFDNIGDVLSLPPLLMEKYVAAAKKIAEQAIATKEKDKLIYVSRPVPDAKPPKTARDAAKECLTRLATRTFRRPPQPDEMERLLKLYDVGEKIEGGDFDKAMKLPIRGLLVSPFFLFHVELEGGMDTYPLSPWELATRLSYFVWASMPDDELFELAKTGKILNPPVIEAQAIRMLKDPKALALSENFTPQWLQIRRLDEMKFDSTQFPAWDAGFKADAVREVVLFFEAVKSEDLSVLNFIDSNFTVVNDRLARHYGIAAAGSGFQKVTLTDPKRGGILTMAAVLAATSDPDRTSPVKRGKWVLETILATPPPPPIPDAANLKADPESARLPLRQRMEKHRADPNCASCHKRMDPIGFGFENYDAIGAWRDQDKGQAIDASAVLPEGTKFNGPVELKNILKQRKSEFVEGFTEKMLTYALGRGVEPYDGPAVKAIGDAVAKNGYKFSSLIVEIVKSYPFQYRQKDKGKR